MKYPAIISYRMCRSILKIQHREAKARMPQTPLRRRSGVRLFRSQARVASVRHKVTVCEIKNSTLRVEVGKAPISRELWIKSELELSTFRGKLCLPTHLLVRRFESAQTADLFHDALGVELVFQPFERSVDRFTFSHNYFGHKNSDLTMLFRTRDK
jgi:hypothetical protein